MKWPIKPPAPPKPYAKAFALWPTEVEGYVVWLEWYWWRCATAKDHHEYYLTPCAWNEKFLKPPESN
jgi:hypothetical protein